MASSRTFVPFGTVGLQFPRQSSPAPRTRPAPVVVMCSVMAPGSTEPDDGPIPPQEMAHTVTAIPPVSQRILPTPSPSDETWARSSDGQANGAALPDVGTLSRSPAASATAERG